MRTLGFILLFLTAMSSLNICSAASDMPSPKKTTQQLNAIAAIINNDIITTSELNKAIASAKNNIRQQQQQMPPESAIKAGVLQQLIYQKIQLQMASRANITATNTQTLNAIHNIAASRKVNIAELKKQLMNQGISYAEFKKNIKQQIIINQLQRQAVSPNVKVTNKDVSQFVSVYEAQPQNATTYHVVDILIPMSSNTQKQQLTLTNLARQMTNELQHGSTVTPLSDGQRTDLGWVTLEQMPSLFTNKIKQAKANTVVGPIKAPNGFHLLLVKAIKKGAHPQPTQQQVKQLLFQQKFQTALQKWLKQLKENSYVKIVNE